MAAPRAAVMVLISPIKRDESGRIKERHLFLSFSLSLLPFVSRARSRSSIRMGRLSSRHRRLAATIPSIQLQYHHFSSDVAQRGGGLGRAARSILWVASERARASGT